MNKVRKPQGATKLDILKVMIQSKGQPVRLGEVLNKIGKPRQRRLYRKMFAVLKGDGFLCYSPRTQKYSLPNWWKTEKFLNEITDIKKSRLVAFNIEGAGIMDNFVKDIRPFFKKDVFEKWQHTFWSKFSSMESEEERKIDTIYLQGCTASLLDAYRIFLVASTERDTKTASWTEQVIKSNIDTIHTLSEKGVPKYEKMFAERVLAFVAKDFPSASF